MTGQRSLRERFLADEGVRILPGTVVEASGWFRISLTATDDMVERGLGGFERARGERQIAEPNGDEKLRHLT